MARRRQRARERKNAALGIPPELEAQGFDRAMMDAMNEEAKARFGLGIGVLVQEAEREGTICGTLKPTTLLQRLSLPRRRRLRLHRAEYEFWMGRQREVAEAVAAERSSR